MGAVKRTGTHGPSGKAWRKGLEVLTAEWKIGLKNAALRGTMIIWTMFNPLNWSQVSGADHSLV